MQDTWYVLENGASADPNEVAPDAFGRLVHKSGVAVAVGPHGYRSRGVDPVAERAKQSAAKPRGKQPVSDKDMKADTAQNYSTREMKAG